MKERMRPLLGSIGFSGLEIDAYLALLEQPNASGYQVAQKIGKLVGSTYKALDSLRAKGAVVANETARPTTFVALSISEYMDARRRDLEDLQVRMSGAGSVRYLGNPRVESRISGAGKVVPLAPR